MVVVAVPTRRLLEVVERVAAATVVEALAVTGPMRLRIRVAEEEEQVSTAPSATAALEVLVLSLSARSSAVALLV